MNLNHLQLGGSISFIQVKHIFYTLSTKRKFRATLTTIHLIKINPVLIQIRYNTPYEAYLT